MHKTKSKWIVTVCRADQQIAADNFLFYQNKNPDSSRFSILSKKAMFKKLLEGIEITFFKDFQF